MIESSKVNIKLELSRNRSNGKLSLTVRFDTNAPNIQADKDSFVWFPTREETDLINEAFGIFSDEKSSEPKISSDEIIEKHLEKPSTVDSSNVGNQEKTESTDVETEDIKNEENSKIIEVKDDSIEDTIEKHIKKEEPLKEADEHTIIDKVISQKKKGRWKKL